MTRRELQLSAALVFVAAFVVRVWAATQLTFPRPEDTAYYVDVARNLLEGHGLTTGAIWSFNTPPLVFPRPAFEVWLPLPTWLAALPMALVGHTFAAAQVSSILLGSVMPVLAWRLALDVAEELGLDAPRPRWLALGTGLTAAVYLPLVLASAQPDSTTPFGVLTLAACLVMWRALVPQPVTAVRGDAAGPQAAPRGEADARRPHKAVRHRDRTRRYARDGHHIETPSTPVGPQPSTALLAGLGFLLGLAALTRNEAVWLALTWAALAWLAGRQLPITGRLRLIVIPALAALAVFVPWAVRDWVTFGTPLPGQALQNALFLDGRDVFAWQTPPTLDRYLAAGLGTLVALRITGFVHNLATVLLVLGVPISALGLLGLPWTARGARLRPLVVFSLATFAIATFVFPVATTWGTFLHAAGAIHVLVILSALLVLDRVVDRIRIAREWTNPVAWIGPGLAVAGGLMLTVVLLPQDGQFGRETEARYAALPNALASAGAPLPTDGSPVITDFPIWLASETGHRAIALPHESLDSIIDLSTTFSAKLLIVQQDDEAGATGWPAILEPGDPTADCFQPIRLAGSGPDEPLEGTLAYRIVCSNTDQQPGQP